MNSKLFLVLSLITLQIVTGFTESVDSDGYCESPEGCEEKSSLYDEGKQVLFAN